MSILTEDLHATLLEILSNKAGTPISLNALSRRLKIGAAALRVELAAMGPLYNVRSAQSGRHIAFLIPTADMLRQEQETKDRATRNEWHPLRRRTDHAAALARARDSHLDLVKEPA